MTVHLLDDTAYRLDYSPSNASIPALDMRALSHALIADCIPAIRDGAGRERFARGPSLNNAERTRRVRINRYVADMQSTIEWLNGADSVVPFSLACLLTDRDPVVTRRKLAEALGLNLAGQLCLIVGPFTRDHAAAASDLLQRALADAPALDSSQDE